MSGHFVNWLPVCIEKKHHFYFFRLEPVSLCADEFPSFVKQSLCWDYFARYDHILSLFILYLQALILVSWLSTYVYVQVMAVFCLYFCWRLLIDFSDNMWPFSYRVQSLSQHGSCLSAFCGSSILDLWVGDHWFWVSLYWLRLRCLMIFVILLY